MSDTVPVCTIDATGLHVPTFATILAYLTTGYQSIYGSDIYLGNDSPDGQLVGIQAAALNDACSMAASVYQEFSPATAQGTGLSSVVKINGIAREVPSYSTVDVLLTGQAGRIVTSGKLTDGVNLWDLPASVTFPGGGSITVTATCETAGAVALAADAFTASSIATPTLGWQNVSNAAAAAPGQPVETDAALRQRQTTSVALPSVTVLSGIVGAVLAVPGVTEVQPYENDSGTTDGNGLPNHSIALVVSGGSAQAIANAIGAKKTPGGVTYGTTTEVYVDPYGIAHNINFFRPTTETITIAITIAPLTGYNSNIGAEIVAALVAYVNGLGIGQDVLLTRLYVPANLSGSADSLTYEVTSLQIAISPGSPGSSDLTIAFNQQAFAATGNVTLTVS